MPLIKKHAIRKGIKVLIKIGILQVNWEGSCKKRKTTEKGDKKKN